jgi:hypothetical protein
MTFLRSAIQDALGPDYVVTRLTVQPSRSIEVLAVIGVAYKVLKDFNDVVDTLRTARDHLTNIVQAVLYADTHLQWGQFVVSGFLTTGVPQLQLGSTGSAIAPHQASAGSSTSLPQIAALRTPIHWDRDGVPDTPRRTAAVPHWCRWSRARSEL